MTSISNSDKIYLLLITSITSVPLSGSPLLYFGDGTCAANAICETELADYLIDCALDPNGKDMVNQTRDIGECEEKREEEIGEEM